MGGGGLGLVLVVYAGDFSPPPGHAVVGVWVWDLSRRGARAACERVKTIGAVLSLDAETPRSTTKPNPWWAA